MNSRRWVYTVEQKFFQLELLTNRVQLMITVENHSESVSPKILEIDDKPAQIGLDGSNVLLSSTDAYLVYYIEMNNMDELNIENDLDMLYRRLEQNAQMMAREETKIDSIEKIMS